MIEVSKLKDKEMLKRFDDLPIEKKDVLKRYNLPEKVVFCKRCVMSNQRPRITFNKEGVCSACQFADKKNHEIDWKEREEELKQLCDEHRSKDGSWDVVVPASGGKDSTRVAYVLKKEYGMHPLSVTWAPHIYTEVGWQNFQNFIHSGMDNILGTPDGIVHRMMTRLAFEQMGEPFQPFIYGQKAFPIRIAVKFNIPLIMFGENGEVEYGGDMKNADKPGHNLTEDMIEHYYSGVDPTYWERFGIPKEKLHYYCIPPADEISTNIKCNFLGYYKKWIPQENYHYAAETTGFQANPDGRSEATYSKYASLDDQLDGFHFYLMFIKFGISRATADAAHEVRDGHITREEAVRLVRKFDGEFPQKHFKVFLDYTGLTEERFWKIIESWRGHVWEKAGGKWRLKNQVS